VRWLLQSRLSLREYEQKSGQTFFDDLMFLDIVAGCPSELTPSGKTTLVFHIIFSQALVNPKFDNPRSHFEAPLQPGSSLSIDLCINTKEPDC
jgi:hypothetical protein